MGQGFLSRDLKIFPFPFSPDLPHSSPRPFPLFHLSNLYLLAMPVVATLSPADLSIRAPVAPNSTTIPSPSNPCRVRIHGLSRYRNEPYAYPVLPPLQNVPSQFQTHVTNSNRLPTLQNGSAPVPPAFQMASRTVSRVKADIARAATYTASDFETNDMPEQFQDNSHHTSFASNHGVPIQNAEALPAAGWAFIRLKHEVLLYRCPFQVNVGDYVVMQGDRGENTGVVQRLVNEPPAHSISCEILRFASDEDLERLEAQRQREEAAKHFAQGVSDALNLNIKIVDTEFQSDGNKLTVYFSSRRMIDFRQLQRQLFKQYRCRIWLVNWMDVIKA